MSTTVSYLQKEPVRILAGAAMNSLTDLGGINEGDAVVTVTPTWSDQMLHQTGTSKVQSYYTGSNVVAEFELAEILNVDMWAEVFATGEKQEDASTPALERFAFNKALSTEPYIGQKATSLAQFWVFRPVRLWVDATTETAGDVVIPKGWSVGPVVLTHSVESAMVLPVEIHGLFDPAATQGENLMYRGISAGTWTAA